MGIESGYNPEREKSLLYEQLERLLNDNKNEVIKSTMQGKEIRQIRGTSDMGAVRIRREIDHIGVIVTGTDGMETTFGVSEMEVPRGSKQKWGHSKRPPKHERRMHEREYMDSPFSLEEVMSSLKIEETK